MFNQLFFKPQLQESCGYRQGKLKNDTKEGLTFSGNPEDPETCDVKKQNTLLCVVSKSKQHLMIHRVVLAIFIPLRLKGYLLFRLLPKRLANTDWQIQTGK